MFNINHHVKLVDLHKKGLNDHKWTSWNKRDSLLENINEYKDFSIG